MVLPKFTAEASLGPRDGHYRMAGLPGSPGATLHPAAFSHCDQACYTRCHASCGPDCSDLVGAARGACLRACRQECLEACCI